MRSIAEPDDRDAARAIAHALRTPLDGPTAPPGLVARLQHGTRARRRAGDGSASVRVVVAAVLFALSGRDASPRTLAVAAVTAIVGATVLVPRARDGDGTAHG